MTDLLALADRCEAAQGPDRELDAAIKKTIGDAWDYAADWGPRDNCNPVAKPYTASIDAVLTLVPDCRRAGVLHHALLDVQRTGFPHSTFLQRLIYAVLSQALRALNGQGGR